MNPRLLPTENPLHETCPGETAPRKILRWDVSKSDGDVDWTDMSDSINNW